MLTRDGTMDEWIVSEVRSQYRELPLEGATVLDVGGHIGAFARYAVEHGATYVTSFEPHPDNYRLLEANAAGFPISTRPYAVTDRRDDVLELWSVEGSVNTGTHSTIHRRGRISTPVPTVAWEDVVTELVYDAVKVDVEGGEYALDLELLPDSVTSLAMELHLNRREWRYDLAPRTLEVVERLGFEYVRVPKIGDKNWTTTFVARR